MMKFSKDFLRGLPIPKGSAAEWMARLYENTAADSTLHLFAPNEYLTTGVLTCKTEWDVPIEQCVTDFERLHAAAKGEKAAFVGGTTSAPAAWRYHNKWVCAKF